MYRLWISIAILSIWQWHVSGNPCLNSGRFPNDDVANCRGYIMCIASGNGGFIQYNLTCPQSFVFSSVDKVCTNVTNFHCETMVVPFDCPGVGKFRNPLSLDCSTYIACNVNYDNTISARVIDCPGGSIFDLVQSECVSAKEFECPTDKYTVPDMIEVTTERTKPGSSNRGSCREGYGAIISLTTFAVITFL